MKRDLYEKLLEWKSDSARKPLIIKGARQVGKTYLITEFGKNEFENTVILNCDKDPRIARLFENGFRTDRILSGLEMLSNAKIVPGKTLLFFDEVGEAPAVLSALKYFCEDAPQYHVIVAGSLLGLAIHRGFSFPVGKVNELTLYPLSFAEFARERLGEQAYSWLKNKELSDLNTFGQLYQETLREYYFIGGMPEVVHAALVENKDYRELRNIQKQILSDYTLDISKHADTQILGRIHQVWASIPQQLSKSNKKFIYGDVQKGARAKDFELAIQWLIDAGIVYKVPRVRKAGIPLKYYEDFSAFKLFMVDHGLMGAMADVPVQEILLKQNVFEEYKGTFTEQYVYEQLVCSTDTGIFYFDSDSTKLELDFLIQIQNRIAPIEVKAEENLRSKSLKQFKTDYPDSFPVRLSMSDYREQDNLVNVPLYAAIRVCTLKTNG